MQLNIKALTITLAILWGLYLFWVVLFGGIFRTKILWASPEIANLVVSIYPGITFTIEGAFLALIWGFACGAFCGGVFGWLYNYLSRKFS
jgi:hypothetical protein